MQKRIFTFSITGSALQHIMVSPWAYDGKLTEEWLDIGDRLQKIKYVLETDGPETYTNRALAQHYSRLSRMMDSPLKGLRQSWSCAVTTNIGAGNDPDLASWILYPHLSSKLPTEYLYVRLNGVSKQDSAALSEYYRKHGIARGHVYIKTTLIQGPNPDEWRFNEIMQRLATHYPQVIITSEVGERLYAADFGAYLLMRKVGREDAACAFLDAAIEADLSSIKLTN
jgi:hypothetical protein